MRLYFWWKDIVCEIREFVEIFPTCKLEKTYQTLEKAMSPVSDHIMAQLARDQHRFCNELSWFWGCRGLNRGNGGSFYQDGSLDPCKKTVMAGEAAKPYWQHVVELHGAPRAIHSYQGARFIAGRCREIWSLLGTKLKYGTTCYPQNQNQVERMKAIIS